MLRVIRLSEVYTRYRAVDRYQAANRAYGLVNKIAHQRPGRKSRRWHYSRICARRNTLRAIINKKGEHHGVIQSR